MGPKKRKCTETNLGFVEPAPKRKKAASNVGSNDYLMPDLWKIVMSYANRLEQIAYLTCLFDIPIKSKTDSLWTTGKNPVIAMPTDEEYSTFLADCVLAGWIQGVDWGMKHFFAGRYEKREIIEIASLSGSIAMLRGMVKRFSSGLTLDLLPNAAASGSTDLLDWILSRKQKCSQTNINRFLTMAYQRAAYKGNIKMVQHLRSIQIDRNFDIKSHHHNPTSFCLAAIQDGDIASFRHWLPNANLDNYDPSDLFHGSDDWEKRNLFGGHWKICARPYNVQGHMEIIQELMTRDSALQEEIRGDPYVMETVAGSGPSRDRMLDWLYIEHKCPITAEVCAEFCRLQRADKLKWALAHGGSMNSDGYRCIVWKNNFEMLNLALATGQRPDVSACAIAARNHNFEMLKALRAAGCPWGPEVYNALRHSQKKSSKEILAWALKNKCPLPPRAKLPFWFKAKA
jgi:hypothetical protein